MIPPTGRNRIGVLQQTLRTGGMKGAFVVNGGRLGRLRNVSPLVSDKASDFTRNLHRNLTEFIGQRFGINATDILCDHEGRLALIAAQPTFMERIINSNGNLEVLGHTVVFEMEGENEGKVYFLKNAGNMKKAAAAAASPKASADAIAPVFVLDNNSICKHTGKITSLSWGSGKENTYLISAGEDGVAKIIDPLRRVKNFNDGTLKEHSGPINCAALASDGSVLITGGEGGKVSLWDLANRGILYRYDRSNGGHRGPVVALAIKPGAIAFASAGEDGRVLVYNIAPSPIEIVNIAERENRPTAIDWNPDGAALAVTRFDSIQLVRFQSDGRSWEIPFLRAHPGLKINAIKWSPNGQVLLSGGDDGIAKIIAKVILENSSGRDTFASDTISPSFFMGEPIISLAWHPSSRWFALASEKNIKVIDTQNLTEVLLLEAANLGFTSIAHVTFSPDGKYLAIAGENQATSLIVDDFLDTSVSWPIKVFRTEDILGPEGT